MRHTIIKTRWGYFGLLCRDESVCGTILPVPTRTTVQAAFATNTGLDLADVPFEKDLLADLQERIVAYFEGENVDFSTDPPVDLTGSTPFGRTILAACRRIPLGRTQTYRQLAEAAGINQAARAVGNIMARNPIPLIVPCHRVVRADGGLGGFSAAGGTTIKKRLLTHERAVAAIPCAGVAG